MTGKSYETRIGTLTFTQDFANGYPSKETYEKLFDEMDFQRACQGTAPRGMEHWVRLADILNREPFFEHDRLIMAMLKPLGIEKGISFNPDARQTEILTEAAFVGEAMAKANDFFNPRLEASHYVEGSRWEYATVSPPDQRWEHYDALDGRAAWFYEAVTNDIAMHGQETGWGQVYLATYQDGDGDWLDGGVNYALPIPANVPAEAFWSMTLYDVDTRCIIKNEQQIARNL